jgi:hypothetical protein
VSLPRVAPFPSVGMLGPPRNIVSGPSRVDRFAALYGRGHARGCELGQVERMGQGADVEGADLEDYDPGKWLVSWLDTPLPALGGRCPGDLLDTAEGRTLVSRTLMQMQAGSHA